MNKKKTNNSIRIMTIIYALFLIYMFIGRNISVWSSSLISEAMPYRINIVPFKTIREYIEMLFVSNVNKNIPLMNLLGNLFVFFPMGFLLPLLKKIKNYKNFILSMIGILIFKELLQLICGKAVFDIDDIILNIIGAIIGFSIWNAAVFRKKRVS